MLLLLPLLAALASTPEALPSATPPPAKLEEIGRIRALPACTPIVVRANSAIDAALGNDSTLAILVVRLRNADYDGTNEIGRRRLRAEFATFSKKLHDVAVAGEGDVTKLRELAAASPNPERKLELKAFADALGGAIFRQKRVAQDLDRALVVQEGRATSLAQLQEQGIRPQSRDPFGDRLYVNIGRPLGDGSVGFNNALRDIADNFSERAQQIAIDEGNAADHSLGATTGC